MLYRILNRRLGYLVKGNSASRILGNTELGCNVPGNSLTLAVRVGCEEYFSGILGFLLQLLNNIALTADVDIMRLKALFNINTETALGKVSDMALGGDNLIVRAEIALYCVSLCRRLNYYKIRHIYLSAKAEPFISNFF